MRSLALACALGALAATGCRRAAPTATETRGALPPWAPFDPAFKGCEGG
jgi:hypothetical protein